MVLPFEKREKTNLREGKWLASVTWFISGRKAKLKANISRMQRWLSHLEHPWLHRQPAKDNQAYPPVETAEVGHRQASTYV